jgi:hypothetical protein
MLLQCSVVKCVQGGVLDGGGEKWKVKISQAFVNADWKYSNKIDASCVKRNPTNLVGKSSD